MAISTYKTFLMKKGSGDTWSKLVDIKSYPDLGGEPETIDVTSLSDKIKTSINGIQSMDSWKFDANYDQDTFTTLKALEGQDNQYAVWFGGNEESGTLNPTGAYGKFSVTGQLSVYPKGGGVNEAVEMGITIACSTVVSFTAGS